MEFSSLQLRREFELVHPDWGTRSCRKESKETVTESEEKQTTVARQRIPGLD